VCAGIASAQQNVRPAAGKPADKKPVDGKPMKGDASLVPSPHPLITEVLFAVPSGGDGDFNLDGTRSAIGDEFVELVNPHDVAINLKGYRLTEGQVQTRKGESREPAPQTREQEKKKQDKTGQDKTDHNNDKQNNTNQDGGNDSRDEERLDITFPDLVLEPGEVVIVFNGFEAAIPGEVGTRDAAAGKHEQFHDAYVFTFGATSKYHALSNTNDMVQLIAPDGSGVQAISWDFRKKNDPATATQPTNQDTKPANTPDSKPRAEPKPQPTTRPGTIRSTDRAKPQAPASPRRPQLPKHADVAIELLEQLTDSGWREGSVQREGKGSELTPHLRIDGRLASPGEWGERAKGEKER
jgi:hypothetical protein